MANDRLKEILALVDDPKRAYDFASIQSAVVKNGGDWESFITKITLQRGKKGVSVSFSFKTVLERPNFLIFHRNVRISELIKVLKDLVDLSRFTVDGYQIGSEGSFDKRRFLSGTKKEDFELEWPADAYFYRIRKNKPAIPTDMRLKRDFFLDASDAIRKLVGFKYFDSDYYSYESVLLFLPLYFAKISRCAMDGKKLVCNLKGYDTKTSLRDLHLRYYYGKNSRSQSRGEISPVQWENEITLPSAPAFVTALLYSRKFEDPVDEYELYLDRGYEWPESFAGVKIESLPNMFRELEAVVSRAGFRDAKAKIVLAAATNLIEVVVTRKLKDLGAKTTGKLNERITRVVEEIRKKEKRNIRRELMPYILKVSRDKTDHAGFDLHVRDEDAVFLLKRTIDFLRQLY